MMAYLSGLKRLCWLDGLCIALVVLASNNSWALRTDEIVVVANRRVEKSVALARYYLTRREIPNNRLLVLSTTSAESCKRDVYNTQIAQPVSMFLQNLPGARIRCLVLIYGLPLKIDDADKLIKERSLPLKRKVDALKQKLADLPPKSSFEAKALKKELSALRGQLAQLKTKTRKASVDSELALLKAGSYALQGWQLNPYFIGFKGRKIQIKKTDVLMVSRIDGPNPQTVVNIINDSIWAEQNGLSGTAYFDARWPAENSARLSGYKAYDNSLHKTARMFNKKKTIPVVIDATSSLFGPGEAPGAAIYCGWYSLAKYVPAFEWRRGAVGYHMASAECRTLKKDGSQVWCKKMIEAGVAATIGPVNEPFIQAFPLPEIFFTLLISGHLSLAECYLASIPFFSWQMILIGDPLYRPFEPHKK